MIGLTLAESAAHYALLAGISIEEAEAQIDAVLSSYKPTLSQKESAEAYGMTI